MAVENAKGVLGQESPRGLKRLALLVLALFATEGGQLPFGVADQERFAKLCAMRGDRFSRIVEELRFDGHLSLDGDVLTLYAGEPTEGAFQPSQTALLQDETPEAGGSMKGGKASPQNAVSAVLDFYCEIFGPRKWGEDDRREVRAALEVATVKELKEAIQGNKLSAFHQGENDRGNEYNTLGHIIRGKQGKKTRRENIEFFFKIYRKQMATTGGSLKAGHADPALVSTRKEEVRRAHRLAHDQEAQERGRRAEAWLTQQGIVTERNPDGYPIWPERGSE